MTDADIEEIKELLSLLGHVYKRSRTTGADTDEDSLAVAQYSKQKLEEMTGTLPSLRPFFVDFPDQTEALGVAQAIWILLYDLSDSESDSDSDSDADDDLDLDILVHHWNPYFILWKRWAEKAKWVGEGTRTLRPWMPKNSRVRMIAYNLRDKLIPSFSWAIPNTEALLRMVETNPRIVEVGSGSGYWAALLTKLGANVTALDDFSDEKKPTKESVPDSDGKMLNAADLHQLIGDGSDPKRTRSSSRTVGRYYPTIPMQGSEYLSRNDGCVDSALFLCWPRMCAADIEKSLDLFRGLHIYYVGEADGCTFDMDDYIASRGDTWITIETIELPTWEYIHDRLVIYKRALK